MGSVRRRLWEIGASVATPAEAQSGSAGILRGPHLVFFLHDELIVHSPAGLADEVARLLRDSAAEAGRLLFGAAPVEFALTVAVVDSYDQAK